MTDLKPMGKQFVVWALDNSGIEDLNESILRQIELCARKTSFQLQPVCVTPPGGVSQKVMNDSLKRKLGQIPLISDNIEILDLIQLPVNSTSKFEAAEALLKSSVMENASFVLLTLKPSTGLSRLLEGSFSESLLAGAKVPVYFLNSTQDRSKNVIVFATDFTCASRKAFLRFLHRARLSGAQVILFHTVSLPGTSVTSAYGSNSLVPQEFLDDQLLWAQQEGLKWKALAELESVSLDLRIISEGVDGHPAKSILRIAQKEGAALIVMSSRSHNSASLILGSVAREVFHSREFPVWIYGSGSLTSTV